MNNRIVTESTALIKEKAKVSLRENWKEGIVAFLLFYIFTITIRNILNLLVDNSVTLTYVNEQPINFVFSGNLYDFFVAPIFSFGVVAIALILVNTNKIEIGALFEGFSYYLKVLWLSILMAIKIALWSLLLIVPGFIAAINYSQSYYILFEDPTKSASQCINESIMLMKGNKMNYFYLLLSFIGWIILAGIAASILEIPLVFTNPVGYFAQAYAIITFIPTAAVSLYMYASLAHFHNLLKPIEGSYTEMFYN